MRKYELVFILKPEIDKEAQKKIIKKMTDIIAELKGKVRKKDIWGKKQMAYSIKKYKEGIYIKFNISLPENKISQWRKKVKLEEDIIRELLIRR